MPKEGFKLQNNINNDPINIGNKEKINDLKINIISNNVIRLFEEQKPEIISPSWLIKNLRNDYDILKNILPKENKKINYQSFINLLPQNIAEKWNIREQRKNISLNDVVEDIIVLFEKEKPEKISPNWIFEKLKSDYYFLNNFLPRENNKINYQPFINLLPQNIAEKWNIQEQRINISMKEIIDDITLLFEKEKPEKISPNWIFEKLQNDYVILKKILKKDKNNKFDYQPLIDLLPKDIALKWNPFLSLEDIVPEESYNNSYETDIVIDKNKDNIHTFLSTIDNIKDNKTRENIIKEMRELIMKGNTDTLDRLIDYLLLTTEGWIINDPVNLKIWEYAQSELKDVIKNCIYRFDTTKGDFSTYLYVTLKKRAMKIKIDSSGGNNFKRRIADGNNIEYHNNDIYDEY
jgi:hypothetical protein